MSDDLDETRVYVASVRGASGRKVWTSVCCSEFSRQKGLAGLGGIK